MFNTFNSKQQEKNSVTSYPEVVYEIHNEFLTAGDKILQEVNSILAENQNKSLDKGKRLASLGFKNSPEVVKAVQIENKIVTAKEIADLIHYYNVNYPNNKFITEEQVEVICKKYNLVFGDISAYKGFIPESKLQQMESFKLKETDKELVYQFGNNYYTWNEIIENIRAFVMYNSYKQTYDFLYKSKKPISKGYPSSKYEDSCFKICAPLKDMILNENQKVINYKIENVPDPVVLQRVRGGYLIVCAWGNEASDEIVVNQHKN